MVVYLDMLLLENFLVNLFLLTITMQTIKKKVLMSRLMLSSAIGASYVFAILIPKLQFFTSTPFKIVVALLMMMISIKDKSMGEVLKATGIFIFSLTSCPFLLSDWYNIACCASCRNVFLYSHKG